MFKTILAASAITIGLATSAMAQYATGTDAQNAPSSGTYGTDSSMMIDRNTTGSIYGTQSATGMPQQAGPMGPCASDTAGPDASAQPGPNDHYCGK